MEARRKVQSREVGRWIKWLRKRGYSGPFSGLKSSFPLVKELAKELKKKPPTILESQPRDPRTIASCLDRYERGKRRQKLGKERLQKSIQPESTEVRDRRNLVNEWHSQLSCPPPELMFVNNLGQIGDNSATLGNDIFNMSLESVPLDIRVSRTSWYPDYTHIAGGICWELTLDGSAKLLCPAERQPGFQKLFANLTDHCKQSFLSWKAQGGRFLLQCIRARNAIRDEAEARAGGVVSLHSVVERIRSDLLLPAGPRLPSRLHPGYSDLIYQLSIKFRRSPNILEAIKSLYAIKKKGLFHELTLGSGEPIATGLLFEIQSWVHLHQSMIREFSRSEDIGQIIELHLQLLSLEEAVKLELDEAIIDMS